MRKGRGMDLLLTNARVAGGDGGLVDVAIDAGRIAAIAPDSGIGANTIDLGGRLISPGFIETHIHLDKACILDRCSAKRGDLEEAIGEVSAAKKGFTPEDVAARARNVIEKAISHGTTHMRTHLEVDPVIGLRGLKGIFPLIEEYRWAIDIEVCEGPNRGYLGIVKEITMPNLNCPLIVLTRDHSGNPIDPVEVNLAEEGEIRIRCQAAETSPED